MLAEPGARAPAAAYARAVAGQMSPRRAGTLALIGAATMLPACSLVAVLISDPGGGGHLLGYALVALVGCGVAANVAGAVAYARHRPVPAGRALLAGAVLLLPTVLPPILTFVARLLVVHEHGLRRETRTPVDLPPGPL